MTCRDLSEEQLLFVVECFAVRMRGAEVHAALKAQWPEVDITQKELYLLNIDNPTIRQKALSRKHLMGSPLLVKRHVERFDKRREQFLADVTKEIPLANYVNRVKMLAEIAESAHEKGHSERVQEALEQIAKEMGGAYTNKRDVTSGGEPVKVIIGIDESQV